MTPPLGLLVSVTSADEAAAAVAAGVDLIDVKDPSRGPLGAAHHETAAAVLAVVNGKVPVSAALGEWTPAAVTEAHWHLKLPLAYVKWGLAGYGHPAGFGEDLLETRRRVPATTEVVAVAYADWEAAKSPPPAELVRFAKRYRYRAFLFDTFGKAGNSLFDHLPLPELKELVGSLKRSGVKVAVGGSVQFEHLKLLKTVNADWVAVRGAVCVGGKRGDGLDPVRLARWKAALT